MATTDRFTSAFLRGDKQGQYQFALEVGRLLDFISTRSGGTQLKKADTPTNNPQIVSPPPAAQFSVQGQGTSYVVQITNPQNKAAFSAYQSSAQDPTLLNAAGTPIYHNLQSASDLTFTSNSNLADHGISPQTHFSIPATGKNTCWRFRSSFDGKTWNAWQTGTAGAVTGSTSAAGGGGSVAAAAQTYQTLPFSATPVFDASQYDAFDMTLTGDVTGSNCPNVAAGVVVTLVLVQDGTGGWTMVYPGNFVGAVPINPAAGSVTVQSFEGRSDGNAYAITSGTAGNLLNPVALPNGTTATTQSPLDDSTKLSTTAYVDAAVAVETARAEGVETTNATAIATETSRAETAEGLLAPKPLTGVTAAMGGAPMTLGQTITANVAVVGATTAMAVACSPVSYPGDGFTWNAYVSAAGTVTVCLTCVLVGTPASSVYNLRCFQ